MPYALSAAPESYLNLLKRSLRLYRTAFIHVFLFALIASIITFIPRILDVLFDEDIFPATTFPNAQTLWVFLIDLGALLFVTAMLWRIQCLSAGTRDTILSDFVRAFKKLPRIFVASFFQLFALALVNGLAMVVYVFILGHNITVPLAPLTRIIIFTVSFGQILLAFYIFYLFYFYLPLILIESKGVISALKTSCKLVWHHLWQTFSVQVTPWLIYLFVIILIRQVLHIDLHLFFTTVENVTIYSTCLNILLFAVFLPWFSTNLLVQLHDLELRKAWHK